MRTVKQICELKSSLFTSFKLMRAYGFQAQGNLSTPIIKSYPHLRIIYTHENQPPSLDKSAAPTSAETSLTSRDLIHVRAMLGARVVYALTHPKIAGALCQTHLLDYRDLGNVRLFGPVLPCLEAMVRDIETLKGGNRQGGVSFLCFLTCLLRRI